MAFKSLDTGEGYMIACERKAGELVFTIERNVFFSCSPGHPLYERISQSDLYHLKHGGKIVVFGEDALTIGRKLETGRGLNRPLFSPRGEPGEDHVLGIMLEAVLQKAAGGGNTVLVTTPSKVVDGPFDLNRYLSSLRNLIGRLGYKSKTINRAISVLFGVDAANWNRRGGAPPDALSICFSEDLVDAAVWTGGRSPFAFSSVRGGRWIDSSVSKMREISPLVVERLREHEIDLTVPKPADKVSMMVGIYVEHMIQYVLQMVTAQVRKAGVKLPGALDVVLSGKNAAVTGFEEKFRSVLKSVDLPFKVRAVHLCSDPLRAAAGGALLWAMEGGFAQAAAAPAAAPAAGVGGKVPGGGGNRPADPASADAGPPPRNAPAGPAPGPSPDLLRKLQALEDRIADIEETTSSEESEYVERLRRAAGIAGGGGKPFTPPKINFTPFFRKMVDSEASDLFLSAGSRPAMRVDGSVRFMSGKALAPDYCKRLVEALARRPYDEIFLERKGIDLAVVLDGIGRFRANLFHQRGNIGCVFRHIKRKVPSFEELNLPARTLMKLARQQRGLILVTGVAGSGKSTSIAAMIEYINQTSNRHIVTIEDPIEFVYEEKQSVVDQREVGFDTDNFYRALKAVVRQSPDVIFVGEMRDKETMEAAISAAETGHLVLSTLHTVNAQQTVERIITFFPTYQHDLIRMQLSMVLAGVVSQRLLPKKSGGGRAPAVEIMLSTPTIKEILLEGRTSELYTAISDDHHFGNQTFNESLKGLYQAGIISLEEALAAADNPDELKLEIRGISRGTRASDFDLT
jgi:twitching motility protein PilT